MTFLSILATIFGIISGFANLPQWIKIFKTKSAKDISIITYSLIFAGSLIWILYGIELRNNPLIITNSFGIVNISLVIFGWTLYGRNKKRKRK